MFIRDSEYLKERAGDIRDIGNRLITYILGMHIVCLLYTSPTPRDRTRHRMPSSA